MDRFVSFIAGSFAAVLILASVLDPDIFLHFEITPGRTVLFYIGSKCCWFIKQTILLIFVNSIQLNRCCDEGNGPRRTPGLRPGDVVEGGGEAYALFTT